VLFERMVIIGPGLVGGSLGLAVRKRRLAGQVVGVGHRQTSIDRALARGSIDRGSLDPVSAVNGADAVILCTAVGLIGPMIEQLVDQLKPGCIVSDVGSTKAGIVRHAEEVLPTKVHFVGAHPIAGSERRGVDYADANLFQNHVCILTPTANTDGEALAKMQQLWTTVGARVLTLRPEQHDEILARTSHLPHVAAAALLAALEDTDVPFVGQGFRDTTRIGSGDPDLWVDILLANREGVLTALESFSGQLQQLREALEKNEAETLRDFLVRARDRRETKLTDPL